MNQQDLTAAQQAAFDTVLTKLRAQGVASIGADGCMYRSPVGCCAVGHLLPADLPLDDYDNTLPVSDLLTNFELPELEALSEGFLSDLQDAHDTLMPLAAGQTEAARTGEYRKRRYNVDERSMAAWEESMAGIASYYGLSYVKPN